MIWPERPDNWRLGGKPAQHVFTQVANTIGKYEPITMLVSNAQYDNARNILKNCLENTLSNQAATYEIMTKYGWYKKENVDVNKINSTLKKAEQN